MSFQKVRNLSSIVDNGLSSGFQSLGTAIVKRPCLTICATVALAFAMAPGMAIGGKESDGERLWVPQDTESQGQQEWVRSTFGAGERRNRVFSTHGKANLLTRDGLVALELLHTGMKTVVAKCEKGTCAGKIVNYTHVETATAKQFRSALSIWNNKAPPVGANILADVNDKTKWKAADGTVLKLGDLFGGVKYDTSGKIISAECLLTTFWLKNDREAADSKMMDPRSEAWELELDEYVEGFTHAALAKNQPWTQRGQGNAGGTAIRGDLGYLSSGYFLLIGFSIVVMSHHKRVQSHGVLALASVAGVILSIMSTFGLCGYLGVKTNPVTTTLYLVLLGIGVDDGYVIMGEFQSQKGSANERVINALTKAGTSIAVTSTTDIVAFAAGCASSLPALRDFCIFAAVGIFWDFFYQSTFFIGVLLMRARGSEQNRPDWLCCIKVDPESMGCCACPGPICSRNGQCVCCPCTKTNADGQDKGLTRLALNKITNFTMTTVGTAVVVFVTVGLLAGACTGIPLLNVDFDIKWFTPSDHAYTDVYKVQEKYFPVAGGLPVYVFTKSGGYAVAHNDGSLAALHTSMSADVWIARSVGNWYTEFAKDAGRSNRSKASEAAFASEVKAFIATPVGGRFARDIRFNLDAAGAAISINAARAMYIGKPTANGQDQIDMTVSTRASVDGKTLNSFAFARPFLYFDGLAVVGNECIQNIIIACVVVFFVSVIMLADIFAAALVLLMIGFVDICILGYMAHWGLDFNSVTAINLVLAVGLAVDYSAHIAHSFLVAKGPGIERAKEAVDHIGMSVFNGAFSTFLAILPLGAAKSYVFNVFFKMWFMIIIFGAYFGLIVLPVFLRFLGPWIGAEQVPADAEAKGEPSSSKVADPDAPVQVAEAKNDQVSTE